MEETIPKTQTAEEILARPRPKSEPPRPPAPQSTDIQFDAWVKEYDKWKDENSHLPNLQPGSVIVQRFKQQGNPQPVNPNLNIEQNARIERLEKKMDKLMNHFGVK